jgi:hypothetical protein
MFPERQNVSFAFNNWFCDRSPKSNQIKLNQIDSESQSNWKEYSFLQNSLHSFFDNHRIHTKHCPGWINFLCSPLSIQNFLFRVQFSRSSISRCRKFEFSESSNGRRIRLNWNVLSRFHESSPPILTAITEWCDWKLRIDLFNSLTSISNEICFISWISSPFTSWRDILHRDVIIAFPSFNCVMKSFRDNFRDKSVL